MWKYQTQKNKSLFINFSGPYGLVLLPFQKAKRPFAEKRQLTVEDK